MKHFIQMRLVLHFILLLLALLIQRHVYATDITGGSLRYEALGKQQYKVIGVVNRNCAGAALSTPVFKIFSGSISFTLTATRTSIKDITYLCSKSTPPCSPSNTTASTGQEQHIFETTVDFSQSPYNVFYYNGKCQVMFSMEACCRSPQTTNISANNFYVEAMLNLCVLGKSSYNSNSKTTPVSYLEMCCNLPTLSNFNNGDMDNDSLLFESVKPKKSKDSFELYTSPLSEQYPMTPYCVSPGTVNCTSIPETKPPRGIGFNGASGDFIITPTNCTERAILNIRTSEYRLINGVIELVGYSTNEIFILIKTCSDNNPPSIIPNNKWSVCEGNKICFTIQTRDNPSLSQPIPDTTYISWNQNIPGATFTIKDPTAREKAAEFCWQTKIGDSRPYAYQFVVTATDSNCQRPQGIGKSYLINVRPRAKAFRHYKKLPGKQLEFAAQTTDTTLSYSYEWQIRDTLGKPPLYKTYKQKDSFIFKDTGWYYITSIINNVPYNCPTVYVDTVYIDSTTVTASFKALQISHISIYPNPSGGLVTLDLNSNLHYTGMTVINNIGQTIYSGAVMTNFDMRPFAKGTYTFRIRSDEGLFTGTVIKE